GTLNDLAWALVSRSDSPLRDPAWAIELAKKSVEIASGSREAWNTLGVAHYRAGDWKEAAAALERSMQLPGGGDAHDLLFMAMIRGRQGDGGQAHRWFDRAREWIDRNKPQGDEVRQFRAEAEALLGLEGSPSIGGVASQNGG